MRNALLFVFVGFHMVLIDPLEGVISGTPVAIAITAVLFARALTVSVVSRQGHDLRGLAWLHQAADVGRPVATLAALRPESSWNPLVLSMTFAAVVFSIPSRSLTIRRMFTKDELDGLLRSLVCWRL